MCDFTPPTFFVLAGVDLQPASRSSAPSGGLNGETNNAVIENEDDSNSNRSVTYRHGLLRRFTKVYT